MSGGFGARGARPDSAGIMRRLATLPDRTPEQIELDRVSASAISAARAMLNGRPWVSRTTTNLAGRKPTLRPRRRVPPCCDHRGRHGHRSEGGTWRRCPTKEAA